MITSSQVIRFDCCDSDSSFISVLTHFLKRDRPFPTFSDLVTALQSPPIDQPELVDRIRELASKVCVCVHARVRAHAGVHACVHVCVLCSSVYSDYYHNDASTALNIWCFSVCRSPLETVLNTLTFYLLYYNRTLQVTSSS